MRLVAVTGGIASGKSAVAARFAELGAFVVDADRIAREVVEPGEPALARIAEEFGPEVLRPDGSLDRAALGARVFADEGQRLLLNRITHPAVLERSRARFAAAGAADPEAVVVYDVPLLVDGTGSRVREFDHIVVVVAPLEERVRRMVEGRGMTEADARARIAAQADDAERVAIADTVIDASGSLDGTRAAVDALWARLRATG